MALLLSVGWWFSSPSEWEPIISAVLATVGLLSIGRGTKSGPTTASVESDGLVVLPFEEAGSADLHGSFGYTLTQEIVRSLSRIRSLRVIAATSSFQLKGTTKDVVTIARELGVRYVLSGRVGRAAEAVRISLELVDGFDSTHVWGETYTSMLDELLDLDEEVGRAIAAALEVKLTPEEDRRLAQRAIDHLHARQCYLRAQQEIYRLTEESLGKARQLLENGLSLMGPNDLLLAALGDVHFQLYNVVGGDRMNLLAAEQYARRALDLNPDSAIALSVMGLVTYKERADIAAAVRWLRRSLKSDPVNTSALFWLPYFLAHSGRSADARPFVKRLLGIDPLIPINHGVAGLVEVMDGCFAAAVHFYRQWHEMEPNHPFAVWAYAYVLINAGEADNGEALLARLPMSTPPTVWDRLGIALRCALQGDADGVRNQVTPEISALVRSHEQFSWHAARFYALAGMTDESLTALRDAMNLGFVNYRFISSHDPFLENVRSDPRFAELMGEMKARWEGFDG